MNNRRYFYLLPMILLLIVAVAGWFATDYLGNKARQEIIKESLASVLTLSTYVSSTLTNFEGAVKSLAGSPWIAPALMSKTDQDIENANSAIDRYNSALNASVTYLMAADGMTLASSNRIDPDSFVGKSYRFRPYFQEATRGQPGRYFALGITSGKRGFYATYPVQNHLGEVMGVVAMKKDIDEIETFFSKYPFCFLINPDGIIFLSGTPSMVTKSLWPIDKAVRETLIASRQFGNNLSEPVIKMEIADGTEVAFEGKDYFVSRKVIDSDGWSIVLMTPTDRIMFDKLIGILATIFVGVLIMVFSGIIYDADRSKEKIRQSEERKRMLLLAVGEGIFGVDARGQVTFINPAALRMLGFAEDEMLGQSVHDRIHHSHEDGSKYPVEDCLIYNSYTHAANIHVMDGVFWRKDDSSFPVEYSSMPIIQDGKAMGSVVNFTDITERRQTAEALRSSLSLLSAALDSTADGLLIVNREGKVTKYNQKFAEMWKIPKDVIACYDDDVQLNHVILLNYVMTQVSDPGQFLAKVRRIYNNPNGLSFDQIEFMDGRVFERYSQPQKIGNNVVGRVWSFRDITERKRIEETLRESEEKFRLTYSSSPDAVNINRLVDGQYVDINEGFTRATGYTREEVIGRTSLEINIWHDPADRQKLVQGLQEKGYYENLEAQFRRKDGSLITGLMSARLFSLKGVSHIISLTRDITDRKLAENELLENRRRLADIIEFLPDATLAIDKEKRIILWNREIEKMTGVPAAEMIGKGDYAYTIPFYGEARPQLMDLIFTDNKDIVARYPHLIREGDSLVAEVFCNALYNNKGAWVFLKASPLHDQSGNIIGAIESIRDITERKRAEAALRESEEKLQRSKKMESLGLLAGGVAHDLNNVLSGIVSYPELILMDLPEDSILRKPIETMKDSGDRAVAIVQDLLTVARGVATIKSPTNLNDLIQDYLKSPEFKTLSKFHPGASVRASLEMDLLNVNGSQVHIRKVLMNLVSNAVEALPDKGTVTLTTMNRYIERPIKGYEDVAIGEYAVLSVSDDGPGISGDNLERIFEPFYSKKVMGRSGTGLGLSVVWNVVQDHKGYIDVTTGMNGTTFELYFPITREELAKENLPIFIDELKGNGETILVVDDVASQRTISCAILNKLGYRTTAVSSGEEAVEFLKENPVDLLLLDMIMDPGINGRETYAQTLVIRPEQKAIIVSGFAQTEEVLEAKRLGTVQFLRKPVSIEKIGLAVKKALVNDSISQTKPTATVFEE